MDSLSHYYLSQDFAARAGRVLEHYDPNDAASDALSEATAFALAAQAHATLALAGVTALHGMHPDGGKMPVADANAWFEVVSRDGLCETDPDGAPGETMEVEPRRTVWQTHPGVLGAWLRGLPLGTILRAKNGDAVQIITFELTDLEDEPAGTVHALAFLRGETFRIEEGHPDLDVLAEVGEFTLLELGEAQDGGTNV